MNALFDIPPHPYANETCRHCAHRETWGFNYSNKTTQHCNIQPDKRNRTGFKRIKVTDAACANF